jgi:hypothetical protein
MSAYQPFLGVLLDHHDGLPLVALQVAQYLKYRIDESGLEPGRRLVDQQHLRVQSREWREAIATCFAVYIGA